jgi:outer membrane immunogenic protein
MKKAAFAFAILCAAVGLASAGPEPLPSGKEMKEIAPAPPACPNWTGFYVGAFGGYKFAATDVDLDLGGSWNGPSPSDPFDKNFIEPTSPHDLDASGAELGGLIGYNYQWNNWVLGLEASGGYLWVRNSDNTGTFTVPATGDEFNVATSFKTHYLVTVAPRVGYAFCRWLPYVTGGLAVGDIDFDQRLTQFDQRGLFGAFFHEGGRTSETELGWMVGGGLEYALTDHWRLRGQYQYIDLGCVDFDSAGIEPLAPAAGAGYTGHHEACLREHNASFAIIYKF